MDWLEITVNTTPDEIVSLSDRLELLGVSGLIIENEAEYNDFLENNRKFWDYVDEEFERSIKDLCRIKFYLEDSPDGFRELERIRTELPREPVVKHVKDEDWENNWKEFYKPLTVGERLLIVPLWEDAPDAGGRSVLRLDPGLIFGTGSHPTTKMCLRALEAVDPEGKDILDLGCGSGILAIAGIVLGARSAMGCDIDPKAPEVAMANAALNGITEDIFSVTSCDVLNDRYMQKKYESKKFDIILANIVADVIIALAPLAGNWLTDGGCFITSGIIDGREDEVEKALKENGFTVTKHFSEEDWHCFMCR